MLLVEKYKKEILAELSLQCGIYATVGMRKSESPMWLVFMGDVMDKIKFVSSQTNEIYFLLDASEDDFVYDFEAEYECFRSMKYAFIKENYPSIYYQIKSI